MVTSVIEQSEVAGGESENTPNNYRNYISFFQSVTTIGIINRAANPKIAELKARLKLNKSDFMCGVVNQTPFELQDTDEWVPTDEVDNTYDTEQLTKDLARIEEEEKVTFCTPRMKPIGPLPKANYDDQMPECPECDADFPIIVNLTDFEKRCIAQKLNKHVSTLTRDECANLISKCLWSGLESELV